MVELYRKPLLSQDSRGRPPTLERLRFQTIWQGGRLEEEVEDYLRRRIREGHY